MPNNPDCYHFDELKLSQGVGYGQAYGSKLEVVKPRPVHIAELNWPKLGENTILSLEKYGTHLKCMFWFAMLI